MKRGTVLLLLLAILALTLGGVMAQPALIGVGVALMRWGWIEADREELLRLFA